MYDSYIVLVRSYFYIKAALAKALQNNSFAFYIIIKRTVLR